LIDAFFPKIVPTTQMILGELRKKKKSEVFVFTISEALEVAKEICNEIAFPYSKKFSDIRTVLRIYRGDSRSVRKMNLLEMLKHNWRNEVGHGLFEDFAIWKAFDKQKGVLTDESGNAYGIFLPYKEIVKKKLKKLELKALIDVDLLKEFGIEFEIRN